MQKIVNFLFKRFSLKKLILSFVATYFIFGALLFAFQRDILYFPTRKLDHYFHEEVFQNGNATINVIVLNKDKKDAVLYFGGNGDSMAYSAFLFAKQFKNRAIYLVNYRGYGGSSGEPTEEGIYSDALFIFDQLKSKYSNISIMGRSLGSGVATYVASKRDIDKLVLVTPFDSIENVAQDRFMIYPMSLLLEDKYNSIGRVKDIKAKTLVIISENDEVVSFKSSMNLVSFFDPTQVKYSIIKDATHNDIFHHKRYYKLTSDFLSN